MYSSTFAFMGTVEVLPPNAVNHDAATRDRPFENARFRRSGAWSCFRQARLDRQLTLRAMSYILWSLGQAKYFPRPPPLEKPLGLGVCHATVLVSSDEYHC